MRVVLPPATFLSFLSLFAVQFLSVFRWESRQRRLPCGISLPIDSGLSLSHKEISFTHRAAFSSQRQFSRKETHSSLVLRWNLSPLFLFIVGNLAKKLLSFSSGCYVNKLSFEEWFSTILSLGGFVVVFASSFTLTEGEIALTWKYNRLSERKENLWEECSLFLFSLLLDYLQSS